ncbi:MAG: glycosyltransferase family 2 protein [Atopobiaceae bacterium]|nr:glycosyltransferase family 2 protein [Atopobiaceae bacterium]MCI1471164.1 glycosyltransferase family 2 protein [Atopobiaceae bacterium]
MTRGRGKIYRLVTIAGFPRGGTAKAMSVTLNGRRLPSTFVHYHGDNWLLVIPITEVTQNVHVDVYDASGLCSASETCVIQPVIAKLDSMRNTYMGNEDILRVRNYDFRELPGFWQVRVNKVMPTRLDEDIVQGEARLLGNGEDCLSGDVFLSVMNQRGEDCVCVPWVRMQDIIQEVDENPGWFVRVLQFSFRVSSELPAFIVNVEGCGTFGYRGMMPYEVSALRGAWRAETVHAFEDERYCEWYKEFHEASHADLAMQRTRTFEWMPTFSIVVPLFNTPLPFFEAMVDSVVRQSYQQLELVLVNASPQNAELNEAISRRAAQDERIRVVTLEENQGISLNTAAGIRAATGDFVAFLDHDDTLTLDALFCYARAVNENPKTDMLYSDEDKICKGKYLNPHFKPDWSPDLLLGENYVCHFLCVRASLLSQVELPDSRYDGSQDHFLTLAIGEIARSVIHVPRVLYHWRIHENSTSKSIGDKPYAVEAGRLAVQAHLDRIGAHAKAIHSEIAPNHYEVVYEPESTPLVSVIIPNKDAAGLLGNCLESILSKTTYENYEIVIVENNSEDDETFRFYEQACARDSRIHVVRYDGPFNYSAIMNKGVAESHGDYLLLLNNDIEVISPDWMGRMLSLAARPKTGAVGARLLFADRTVQHCGVVCSLQGPLHVGRYHDEDDPGYMEILHIMHDVSAVTAACLMVSRNAYERVGGMDEGFPVDYNDVDFCLKLREIGLFIVIDPSVELFHYESVSRGYHTSPAKKRDFALAQAKLKGRWPDYYALGDPFYNPNFNPALCSYVLAWN